LNGDKAIASPIEQEGTYPLPEAQLDRFLLHVKIDYPAPEHEKHILHLARNEAIQNGKPEQKPTLGISQESLFNAHGRVGLFEIQSCLARGDRFRCRLNPPVAGLG
jgi:MoxR-like ATPase